MGKINNDTIKLKLINEFRNNWRKFEWQGINLDTIQDFEKVEPILCDDFRYEGSGEEYKFTANIYFMIKEQNNPLGASRKTYGIFPYCKMLIEEIDNDFNVRITTPIPLQKIR